MDPVCRLFENAYGNGHCSEQELSTILVKLGLPKLTADSLLDKFDRHGQHFAYRDFLAWLNINSTPSVSQTMVVACSHYDLLVLGAGPAGVKAAIAAASRGYRVGLLEPKACLTGAPTGAHSKCLREAVIEGMQSWPEIETFISRVLKDAQETTARLLRTFHIDVLKGSGAFVDVSTIRFTPAGGGSQDLTAGGIIIATGSRANRLPMIPFNLPGVFDSDTIAGIDYIPKCLVVQGGGIVGLEYAHMFAKMGAKVIVIEFFDKIVQMLDVCLQQALLSELVDANVEILLKTGIKTVESIDCGSTGRSQLRVDTGERVIECDCLLSATGRSGFTEGLALESINLKLGRGKMIPVDENQYTGIGKIYAVGDVVAGNLATVGKAQAVRAVQEIFGPGKRPLKVKDVKAYVVWSIPDIAWVGLTEQEAIAKELNFGSVVWHFGGTLRGIVEKKKGHLKLIYDRDDGKVLGVHIVGMGCSEMINYGAEVIDDGGTIYDILRFVFPAVTLHEVYKHAAIEAKIRLSGVKSISAATAWLRIRTAITAILEQKNSGITPEELLCKTFRTFDIHGTGLLEAHELRESMKSLALDLSESEVEDMIKEVDANGNGVVDYDEFVQSCEMPALAAADCSVMDVPKNLFHTVDSHYDLLVIGAGPAGVRAAVEAASRGYRVGLLEPQASLTGAPTGAHSKCVREAVLQGKRDWAEIKALISYVQRDAKEKTARLLRTFHINVLKGSGAFIDVSTVQFSPAAGGSQDLTAGAIIIATGSRANRLPMIPFDLPGVFDSDTIAGIDYIPKCLVVQGGGIVGLEYAHMFAKLGAKVIVIEFFDKIVQMLDVDLQQVLLTNLEDSNVEILLKTGIQTVKAIDGSLASNPALRVDTGERVIDCDCLLSATGRSGFTEGLALEKINLKLGRGKMIPVDENQYTGIGNIYAVGDVVAGNLATIGQAQAVRAVRKLYESGTQSLRDEDVKPSVVWTIPDIAWAGLTEQEASAKGMNFGTVRARCLSTLRGIVSGEHGFVKFVYDRDSGKILGVHLIGTNCCEVINFGAEAVRNGDTIYDVLQSIFPAVTLHEAYSNAAEEAVIRLSGVQSLSAVTAWRRMRVAIQASLDQKGSAITPEEDLCATFRKFDIDGSGLLTVADLRTSLQILALPLSDAEVEDMIKEVDAESKGTVSYSDFKQAYNI